MKTKCCRRDFIKTSAGIAVVAATTRHSFAKGKDEEVEVDESIITAELGSSEKLADGVPHLIKAKFKDFEGNIVETEKVFARWVKINSLSGRWIVVSAICQHLKCKVEFFPDAARFICPCHGSEYDINGNMQNGPTKRDLPDYTDQVVVEDGVLMLKRELPE